jgi:hypothetical protein
MRWKAEIIGKLGREYLVNVLRWLEGKKGGEGLTANDRCQ